MHKVLKFENSGITPGPAAGAGLTTKRDIPDPLLKPKTDLDWKSDAYKKINTYRGMPTELAVKFGDENITKPEGKNGGGFASTMSKMPAGIGSMVGNTLADIGSAIGNKYDEDFTQEQKTSQAAVRGVLEKIPVVGHLISAASGLVDSIGSATGLNLSNIDKDSADRAGIKGAATFNNVMNMLPGNSMLWGIFGGKRTDKSEKSQYIDQLSNAYADTVGDINAAGDLSEKRLLFGKKDANAFIQEQNRNNSLLTDIAQTNTLRKKSDYGSNLAQQNLNRYAGTNYMDMRVGKHGLKLASIEEIREMLSKRKEVENVEKFANGGLIEGGNLMPVGKLHKELHHIGDSDPELAEGLTRKGIPVVTLNEGGEVEQVAEIERDEIVFSLELTQKIEALWKDGSEEAMIEAGKILVDEILFNTNDKGGIINDN